MFFGQIISLCTALYSRREKKGSIVYPFCSATQIHPHNRKTKKMRERRQHILRQAENVNHAAFHYFGMGSQGLSTDCERPQLPPRKRNVGENERSHRDRRHRFGLETETLEALAHARAQQSSISDMLDIGQAMECFYQHDFTQATFRALSPNLSSWL